MNDMSSTIIAKSDQLNADDLIGKSITIRINDARVTMGDQPCTIGYDGDNGKPWKPGKSMRRVLVAAWGPDPKMYVGRHVTLYRDPDIMFGGVKVGGIRISHMSNIAEPMTIALTVKQGSKKPFQVKPLQIQADTNPPPPPSAEEVERLKTAAKEAAKSGLDALKTYWTSLGGTNQKAVGGAAFLEELKVIATPAPAATEQTEATPQTSGAAEEVPFDV